MEHKHGPQIPPYYQQPNLPHPLAHYVKNKQIILVYIGLPTAQPSSLKYKLGAELLWQLMLNYLRHILYTTAPTHAIFSHLRDPQGPLAQAAQAIPSSRLHLFWFMDGLGNPSKHLIPFLVAMRHPYESLILDMQRQTAITNSGILRESCKKLGAYPCTSLDAC